jgi:hypothetical protein
MRRLMALFVMLAALGVCAPVCYAPAPVADLVLVYKLTIRGKVVDKGEEEIISVKFPAYLVLSIDENAGGADIINAGLVLYGKIDGQKKYQKIDSVTADLTLLGYPDDDIHVVHIMPPNSEAIIFGKIKLTNVGFTSKRWIPTSLTGGVIFDGDFFGLGDFVGSGTVSAKLDSKLTKANVSVGSTSPVVTAIVNALEDKGYELL